MTTLYVSGPITGDPDYRAKFAEAERKLREAGYDVVNPARNPVIEGWTWLDYMRLDVAAIASRCDGLATLWDWQTSRGARVEVDLAYGLGLDVHPVHHWITLARTA